MIKIWIPIEPKGQRRARATVIAGHAKVHKDPKQKTEEQKLLGLLYEHRPEVPLEGPLWLELEAVFPVPKSKSKQWKVDALNGKNRPTRKPDASNLLKHLEDVMNGIFFGDDSQIVHATVSKIYGQVPGWSIALGRFVDLED